VTEKSFDEHFATNVKSALLMSQAAARVFKPGAVIINISSLNSRYPRATSTAPRKRRLRHSPAAYHGSWGPRHSGRRCGTWHGGYANAPGQQQTEALNAMIERKVLRRIGKADEIAAVVAFLATHDAGFLTDETVHVNGGQRL
jgi:NAD(P)-dependent dehydrogenase (short-subunit alcohol dehydrogenase family)